MATYEEIQNWVKANHGWTPETCWIAHCKELFEVPVRRAHNRPDPERAKPCPEHKRTAIYEAFRYCGMLG